MKREPTVKPVKNLDAPPTRPAPERPRTARAPREAEPHAQPTSEPTPEHEVHFTDDTLRRWFDDEVETLQRLAHTQRLKGDYVAAQFLERDIRRLAAETAAVLRAQQSKR